MPGTLISLVRLIRDGSTQIQPDILRSTTSRGGTCTPTEPRLILESRLKPVDNSERSVREAIELPRRQEQVSDTELWNLIGGDTQEPAPRHESSVGDATFPNNVLACLSHDVASIVRASAAQWIARWLRNPSSRKMQRATGRSRTRTGNSHLACDRQWASGRSQSHRSWQLGCHVAHDRC